MNKRLILTCVLGALLALLCAKFMLEDGQQPSTGKQTASSDARMKPPTKLPPSKSKSTTPPEAGTSSEPTMKKATQLVAGGRQWKLSFADQSLPDEIRHRIGYDLNLVFGHLPETVIDTLPFPLEVDGRHFDRRVRFEGGENRRPKILTNSGFAYLAKGAGESELYVPKLVGDAYRKAIELETRVWDPLSIRLSVVPLLRPPGYGGQAGAARLR
jgi:hypothetical protein